MRIWFDTEFYEDGRTIELISIGMVREDGATYYAEVPDCYEISGRDPWLVENVRPHLGWADAPRVSRAEIAQDLLAFAGDAPEFWAYYADYDWVALCQLYGRMIDLPKGWPMFCRDLKQLCVDLGNPKLPSQEDGEHNALADAFWNRSAHSFLIDVALTQA
jgi:hypothetical protein